MLKRLREITGDAILVRGRNGMTPTDRGHELLQLAQQALKLMESIASPAPDLSGAYAARVSPRCAGLFIGAVIAAGDRQNP
jgi:DNA-binding transcriptional LysR family regulator